jgi:leucyl-tRNA synthetase
MPEIKNIFANALLFPEAAYGSKDNVVIANFLNGLNYKEATKKVIAELEKYIMKRKNQLPFA